MIILDTHAWIWWMNESNKLSVKAIEVQKLQFVPLDYLEGFMAIQAII
jgi:hypothetical protein